MTDHDPLCPTVYLPHAEQVAAKLVEVICEDSYVMACDLKALEAIARKWERALAERDAARADTEYWKERQQSAAANLVSITSELNEVTVVLTALRDERDAARAEASDWKRYAKVVEEQRDAARAEVAALREQYVVEEFIDTDGYPSMRVVKGEHVGHNEWAANIRREVLADLRAKVEGMRDEAKADPVGSAVWRTTAYESVLALIEIEEVKNDFSN